MSSPAAIRILLTSLSFALALNASNLDDLRALVSNTTQYLQTQELEVLPLSTPSYIKISVYSDSQCTSAMMNRALSSQLNLCVSFGSTTGSYKITLDSPYSVSLDSYTDNFCSRGVYYVGSISTSTVSCVYNTDFAAYVKKEITSTSFVASPNEGISYR